MSADHQPRRSARLVEQNLSSIRREPIGILPRIPAEIRLNILQQILVSSEHLAFTRTWLPQSKKKPRSDHWSKFSWRDDISPVLRLCLWNKTENNEPIALGLHKDFVNLCLVSKDVRDEAVRIFFGRNEWVLHISKAMNSIDWMVEKWGKESLRKIKVLRIEAQSVGFHDDWQLFKGLERFVDVVKEGARLHLLSVSWKHARRHLQSAVCPGRIPHVYSIGSPSRRTRKTTSLQEPLSGDDGEIKASASDEWYAGWPAKEMVLMPLKELRGLNGIIEGYVTDNWALWLEEVMRAEKGKEMGGFIGKGKAKEVAQMLKLASSSEEFVRMIEEADPDL